MQITLITNTLGTGAADMAVVQIDTNQLAEWQKQAMSCKQNFEGFSELRVFGSHAEFYSGYYAHELLDSLRDKLFNTEEFELLEKDYMAHGYFVWPDYLELPDMVSQEEEEEEEEEELWPEEKEDWPTEGVISVDVEEVVLQDDCVQFAALSGDSPVMTFEIPYDRILKAGA